jgi:hypothetical protein
MGNAPETVGENGNPERLVIEGTTTFTPKEIKNKLLLVPEFQLAADSSRLSRSGIPRCRSRGQLAR